MSGSQQLLAIACQNITFTLVKIHHHHGEMLRLPSNSFDDLPVGDGQKQYTLQHVNCSSDNINIQMWSK
jgi:hypothetical protein